MFVVELGLEPPSRITIQTIAGPPYLFRVEGVVLTTHDVPTLNEHLPFSCITLHPDATLANMFGLTDNCDGIFAGLQEGREVDDCACDEPRAPLLRYHFAIHKQSKTIRRQDLQPAVSWLLGGKERMPQVKMR